MDDLTIPIWRSVQYVLNYSYLKIVVNIRNHNKISFLWIRGLFRYGEESNVKEFFVLRGTTDWLLSFFLKSSIFVLLTSNKFTLRASSA